MTKQEKYTIIEKLIIKKYGFVLNHTHNSKIEGNWDEYLHPDKTLDKIEKNISIASLQQLLSAYNIVIEGPPFLTFAWARLFIVFIISTCVPLRIAKVASLPSITTIP